MNAAERLHEKGQSLWLDNITRELLTSGTLRCYIDEFSVTGLTSNPTIFRNAIKDSAAYDAAINTMPEGTLKAFADHGEIGPMLPADGGDCEAVLDEFAKAGVDIEALAARLQDEGAASFVKSWNELIEVIASKGTALKRTS